METDDAKALGNKRKQSVETVFGIIKNAMGFRRFHLRGIKKAATEWTLITLAYNCRRIHRLQAAKTSPQYLSKQGLTNQSDRLLESNPIKVDRLDL